MKQSERLILIQRHKQEIQHLNTELERKKAIVSELLDDCDHTNEEGNSLAEEMTTLIDEISMCVGVCKICGAWLGLETSRLASVGKGCDSFEAVRKR